MARCQQYAVPAILWLAMLLASSLPGIVCHEFLGVHVRLFHWFDLVTVCQFAALLALTFCTLVIPGIRSARDSLLVMTAFFLGWFIVGPPIFHNSRTMQWAVQQFGIGWATLFDRLSLLIPAVLMTAVILGRYRRQDLFLAWGRFSAPVRWSILFPLPVRSWSMMLAIGLVLAVGLLGTLLIQTIGFDWTQAEKLLPHLPAVVATAIFNAAAEEYVFRMLPLAVLLPAVGPRQAIAMTAVHFGVGHWYGQPSGPLGVLLMAYAGWALAKSMVETEGAGWAFCLHAFGDLMIFSLLVMA
jgi:membrane protease YdiL (CAAX protease family)